MRVLLVGDWDNEAMACMIVGEWAVEGGAWRVRNMEREIHGM